MIFLSEEVESKVLPQTPHQVIFSGTPDIKEKENSVIVCFDVNGNLKVDYLSIIGQVDH